MVKRCNICNCFIGNKEHNCKSIWDKCSKTKKELFKKGLLVTPFKGRHHTKENREILRNLTFKQFNNPELKEKHRIACINRRHKWNDEERKMMSERVKKFHMEHPEKHPNRVLCGHNISKPQMELYLLIKEIYPEAQLEYPIKTLHSIRFADIGLPSRMLDIEFDNSYWHNELLDNLRTMQLEEVGWRVIRFSNSDKPLSILKISEKLNNGTNG